ncbi:hypothetical protein TRIHO_06150 [Tritonibacter horizontis]|uniref:Uncharacterized protein n=1 Tax=Tritonibacter horizontis TaxID=1768241 RepID=A0A132C279_9RHOB|nr:hypothetical protein TRIHO_06150 [Tritonibacter horizontis]
MKVIRLADTHVIGGDRLLYGATHCPPVGVGRGIHHYKLVAT